ncbi:hypothetical protein Tco_1065360, partial [Tanacetum coccineum]
LEARKDHEEESGFTWEVVMLGYGCGALLGLVMGYLMLSTRKVKWFNDAGEQFGLEEEEEKTCLYREMTLDNERSLGWSWDLLCYAVVYKLLNYDICVLSL